MSTITGTWRLRMKTPIGTIETDYRFDESDGATTGTATRDDETVPLRDIVRTAGPDGERVTWRQSITRPLRLDLDYDVTVSGDALTGRSRAGRLPGTVVTGKRIGG